MAQHQTSATPTNAEALRDIERVDRPISIARGVKRRDLVERPVARVVRANKCVRELCAARSSRRHDAPRSDGCVRGDAAAGATRKRSRSRERCAHDCDGCDRCAGRRHGGVRRGGGDV